MKRCRICGSVIEDGAAVCSVCGFSYDTEENPAPALSVGTRLKNSRYAVEKCIAAANDSFPYFTYLGWDAEDGKVIAVRQYCPGQTAETQNIKGLKDKTGGLQALFEAAQKQVDGRNFIDCFLEGTTFYQVMDTSYANSVGFYSDQPVLIQKENVSSGNWFRKNRKIIIACAALIAVILLVPVISKVVSYYRNIETVQPADNGSADTETDMTDDAGSGPSGTEITDETTQAEDVSDTASEEEPMTVEDSEPENLGGETNESETVTGTEQGENSADEQRQAVDPGPLGEDSLISYNDKYQYYISCMQYIESFEFYEDEEGLHAVFDYYDDNSELYSTDFVVFQFFMFTDAQIENIYDYGADWYKEQYGENDYVLIASELVSFITKEETARPIYMLFIHFGKEYDPLGYTVLKIN